MTAFKIVPFLTESLTWVLQRLVVYIISNFYVTHFKVGVCIIEGECS